MNKFFVRPGLPRLAVSDSGGGGRPVVFQHGLTGDSAQTAEVFPEGWRRVTLECRGHGASEAGDPASFSIAAFTGDVISLIEAEGIGACVVGGISMGAAIALRLAVTRPDLVRGLVLGRPAWVFDAGPANMAPVALVGELLSRHDPETARAVFDGSREAAELAERAPDNLDSLRSFFTREPIAVTAALLSRISVDGPGVTGEQVAGIAVPTLVVVNERDTIHPLSHARRLAEQIPGARLVQVAPKADDHQRYVAEFRAALRDFLAETCP
jgi:pimeloyl-ACP methyl ester carboxylesterase